LCARIGHTGLDVIISLPSPPNRLQSSQRHRLRLFRLIAKENTMLNRTMTFVSLLIVTVVAVNAVGAETLPENVARTAKVTASSQYSGDYRASLATNGSVLSSDWAVKGMQHGEFMLEWAKPVDAAQIEY